jgi:hypothetical protein
MSLLNELAIMPEVFASDSYSTKDRSEDCLLQLEPILLTEAVLRNISGGHWKNHLLQNLDCCSLAGQKVVKALVPRLRDFEVIEYGDPQTSDEWCWAALAGHNKEELDGIVVGHECANRNGGDGIVCAAERVHEANWWRNRRCSVTLERCTQDYIKQLERLLRFAKSAAFIDPHLDPTVDRYADFHQLLGMCRRRETPLWVSIHRGCYRGSGPDRHSLTEREAREMFEPLAEKASRAAAKVRLEVSVWEGFHDRFLITDLLGLSVPNGFDIDTRGEKRPTRWTRLSRDDSDSVLRDFDENNPLHGFKFKFLLTP